VFNDLVIWLLSPGQPRGPMKGTSWKTVDWLLDVLAKRNPNFRVALMGYGGRSFIRRYLPLVMSSGLMRLGSSRVENRFRKLAIL